MTDLCTPLWLLLQMPLTQRPWRDRSRVPVCRFVRLALNGKPSLARKLIIDSGSPRVETPFANGLLEFLLTSTLCIEICDLPGSPEQKLPRAAAL